MPGLAVRPALVEDAQAIAVVHVRSWQAAYRGVVPDEVLDGMAVEPRQRWWTELLGDPPEGHRVWVAVENGNVVGFAATGVTRDEDLTGAHELYAMYVTPDRFGAGIGQTLMDRVFEDFRSRHISSATLWVLEDNPRARRFYEIAGWVFDGAEKVEDFGGHQLPVVRYRVELATG